jgi:hypothetical protein
MIYELTIECVFGLYLEEECIRVIEIDEESSLWDLHSIIQEAVDFDYDHLFEFYAGRNVRNRSVVFCEVEDYEDMFEKYSEIKLKDIYPLDKSMKLYYWFDFGDDWKFEIKKSRKKIEKKDNVNYPIVVKEIGENPTQYPDYE